MAIAIRRTKDPFGWMGNMSPFPVEHQGRQFRTTEALFQCLRFEDEDIIEAICAEKSPMGAKFTSKKFSDRRVIEPLGQEDLDNMRLCLRLKVEQHPSLKEALKETQGELIVEDCTKRQHGTGLFWGAALQEDGSWVGDNWLGCLWMELREEFLNSS